MPLEGGRYPARATGLLAALALTACGGGQPPPDYLTTEPHKLTEEKRAYALFAQRYEEERIRQGGVHCEPHMGGNSRSQARRIAMDRAREKAGSERIQFQSTGLVRLIRTWYCALMVPSD